MKKVSGGEEIFILTVWTGFGIVTERKGDFLGAAVFGTSGRRVLVGRGVITYFADEPLGQTQRTIVNVVGELRKHSV